MKVLFDTNIILDVLLNREPFIGKSAQLVGLVEQKKIEGYLCATTITTLDYLLCKTLGHKQASLAVHKLLSIFNIADVNAMVLRLAIHSEFKDFEDAAQYFSGECCVVDALVTRNIKDYKASQYPVYTPDMLLKAFEVYTLNQKT